MPRSTTATTKPQPAEAEAPETEAATVPKAPTARFRGTGGAEFELAVPAEGTPERREFERRITAGELTPID